MTGDSTVNRGAPILCCTAEILSKIALQRGPEAEAAWVIMDEFHFFGDRERGMAWLVPLLELKGPRFLLMSATLKDPESLRKDLESWTGAEAMLIEETERPVPLVEEYKELTAREAIEELLEKGMDPVYVVSLARNRASGLASELEKTPMPDALKAGLKAGKAARDAVLAATSFDTPFGKRLVKHLRKGVAVHHGGMLPKYRRVVEKLAKQRRPDSPERALALICGTNTLGVVGRPFGERHALIHIAGKCQDRLAAVVGGESRLVVLVARMVQLCEFGADVHEFANCFGAERFELVDQLTGVCG